MNKSITILMLLLASVVFAQRDVVTKTIEAKRGGTLELEANPGDIFIKTWNKNEVLLKVDGLDKNEAEYLEVKSSGDIITVKYNSKYGWGGSADYFITVPSEMNLSLLTTGGDIEIQNDLTGNVKVNTMGGDIEVHNINGNAQLETMGGDITFRDISGDVKISSQGGNLSGGNIKGSSSELKTMGGDIRLNKINNVKKVTTFGGNIEVNESTGDVELTTFGGNIRLTTGQNNVKAKTYGGNIYIGKANGDVDVNTGAGNIELKQISGNIIAKTSAGNIEAEILSLSSKESDLKTFSGDIRLIISSNIKATIDAEAVTVDWNKDKNRIIRSDFPGKIEDKRGRIVGEFILNGGGTKIELKTNLGEIQINKK
ncbi:MAG: hypothetical protein C4543_01290 [Ignavibacteriales bacterium]|jgi:DUF4097 and DUF4098 domain-containing protein YvlB|nr:MAG: hypothetical protein C4543_01290 [Ignavibacteriales bacterium]